jgi:hypothetical protein
MTSFLTIPQGQNATNSGKHCQAGFAYCLFSQVFPQLLSEKLTHHQKNDHFDVTGANLSYSKQVKAVSIPEKDKSTSLQVLGFRSGSVWTQTIPSARRLPPSGNRCTAKYGLSSRRFLSASPVLS